MTATRKKRALRWRAYVPGEQWSAYGARAFYTIEWKHSTRYEVEAIPNGEGYGARRNIGRGTSFAAAKAVAQRYDG